jgi:hypothetical protein
MPTHGSDQPPEKLNDASQESSDHPICFTLLLQEAEDSAKGKEQLRRYLASVANAPDGL